MEVNVEQQAFVGPELKRQERSSVAAISESPNSNLSRLASDERLLLIPPAALRPTPPRACLWELIQIMSLPDLSYIAAPMVNQSDLPFRILVRRYGASLVYTQMLLPERLLNDQEYLEFHRRGLQDTLDTPVVVQLCGNDPDVVVRAARTVVDKADAIGAYIRRTLTQVRGH